MKDAAEPHLRVHALEALARISPSSKELSDAVARMLDQPHVPKIMVLESLAKGGPVSKEMLKGIEEMMRDKNSAGRLQAALVVGKANRDHPAVVSILIESQSDRDSKTPRTPAATIAILDGQPTVGLSETELREFAGQKSVLKASRRDLAAAIAQRKTAATTVAATMALAHLAGIRLFATGGIGGAHRESHPWDISA